jgi:hypothetical protein
VPVVLLVSTSAHARDRTRDSRLVGISRGRARATRTGSVDRAEPLYFQLAGPGRVGSVALLEVVKLNVTDGTRAMST